MLAIVAMFFMAGLFLQSYNKIINRYRLRGRALLLGFQCETRPRFHRYRRKPTDSKLVDTVQNTGSHYPVFWFRFGDRPKEVVVRMKNPYYTQEKIGQDFEVLYDKGFCNLTLTDEWSVAHYEKHMKRISWVMYGIGLAIPIIALIAWVI